MGGRDATRRDFLRTATLAGALSLTGLACDATQPPPPPEKPATPAENTTPKAATERPKQAASKPAAMTEALFRVRGDGVTVHTVGPVGHELQVRVGSDPGQLSEPIPGTTTGERAMAVVAGQSGGAVYLQSQVRADAEAPWQDSPVRKVQLQRPPGQSFRMAVLADTHTRATLMKPGAADAARATAQAIVEDDIDFAVFIGDEAMLIRDIYKGRRVEAKDVREAWLQWRSLYSDLLARVPCYLVLGNHEGEAGYYQNYPSPSGPLYLQRTATIGRKQFLLNPRPDTYPEGGEDQGWRGDQASPATGGAAEGNCSPLENYFAWTWGDALFVVLDVQRYTNPGGGTPGKPEEWTLGEDQLRWFEQTLQQSAAPWKVVLCHHLVGGWPFDGAGRTRKTKYCYGRGGGKYARVGEQARVNDLMKQYGAQFFLYGHDHVFAHQPADDIEFVCCGRPSYLNTDWYDRPAWPGAYGSFEKQDFISAVGYTRLDISPDRLVLDYVRAAADVSNGENVTTPIGESCYSKTYTRDS